MVPHFLKAIITPFQIKLPIFSAERFKKLLKKIKNVIKNLLCKRNIKKAINIVIKQNMNMKARPKLKKI